MSTTYTWPPPPPPPPPKKESKILNVIGGIIGVIIVIALVAAFIRWLFRDTITALAKMISRALSPPKKPAVQQAPHAQTNVPIEPPPFTDFDAATMEGFLNEIERDRVLRFSPQQLQSCTNNYTLRLGSGSFGEVYKGVFPNGVEVAVKVLKGTWNKRIEEQFMAEVGAISKTHHINLVKLYGFCFDRNIRALVYEYMKNGSLDTFLFNRNRRIEWERLQEIAIRTAKGIAYLHEECRKCIIHYDLKPANILIDSNFSPKVADFGLARLGNRDQTHMSGSGFRGTPGYAAPELGRQYHTTHKCDVYSFGIILFEIVGRRKVIDRMLPVNQQWFPGMVWEMLEQGRLDEIMVSSGIEERNRDRAKRMVMVALWCVQQSPEERPVMSTVVKMLEGVVEVAPPPNPFPHLM